MHGMGRRVYQFFISSKRWDCGPREVSIYQRTTTQSIFKLTNAYQRAKIVIQSKKKKKTVTWLYNAFCFKLHATKSGVKKKKNSGILEPASS